eukprot:901433-Rhodomonas_salina.3
MERRARGAIPVQKVLNPTLHDPEGPFSTLLPRRLPLDRCTRFYLACYFLCLVDRRSVWDRRVGFRPVFAEQSPGSQFQNHDCIIAMEIFRKRPPAVAARNQLQSRTFPVQIALESI